jgi:hypothetical protein
MDKSNHWAVFEGWIMIAAYVRGIATKEQLEKKYWEASLQIAEAAADQALDDLKEECVVRQNDYVEGNYLVDGYVYRFRQLMLTGLLSSWCLGKRDSGQSPDEEVITVVRKRLKEAHVWGESGAPFLLAVALELEQECRQISAENVIFDYLRLLIIANAEGNRGMPNSFASIEDSIGFMHLITDALRDNYQGFSYTMEPCVEFLARRMRRRGLAAIWRGVTRVSLDKSVPQEPWEWFRWNARSAIRFSSFVDEPQSWSSLYSDAEANTKSTLPSLLISSRKFLLSFLLVYPHRFTPETVGALDALTFH